MHDDSNGNGRARLLPVHSRTGGEATWETAPGVPLPSGLGRWPTSPAWKSPSHWVRRRDVATAACIALVLLAVGGMYVSGDLLKQRHPQQSVPTSDDPFAVTPANGGR